MTLAEKKLAAQQLGMSIQDFENFMQEDRELSDLESITKDVDPSEGFEQMTKNMKLAFEPETLGSPAKPFVGSRLVRLCKQPCYWLNYNLLLREDP